MTTEIATIDAKASTTPFVFAIPEANFEKMVEKFAKMTKRARKCRLVAPRFEVIHEQEEMKTCWIPDPDGMMGDRIKEEYWTNTLFVTVEGQRPTIGGWDFVAVIDHAEESNIIRSVPGFGNIPISYRNALPVCLHCNTARRRLETFVLHHAEHGYKQVGRNCLQDFFPGESPEDVATLLEWWAEAVEMATQAGEEQSDGGGNGGGFERLGLESLIATASLVIDVFGWMSRTKSREFEKAATADIVLKVYDRPHHSDSEEIKSLRKMNPTEQHLSEIATAFDWVRNLEPGDSDYLYSLQAICKGETVRRKYIGLAVSLLAAYRRTVEQAKETAEKATRPASNHIGVIGERAVFHGLTLEKIGMPSDSDWGVSTLLVFRDPAGNLIKWFMSGLVQNNEWVEGTSYDVVATPKKHGEFKGQKDTVVNRLTTWDGKWKAKKKAK